MNNFADYEAQLIVSFGYLIFSEIFSKCYLFKTICLPQYYSFTKKQRHLLLDCKWLNIFNSLTFGFAVEMNY